MATKDGALSDLRLKQWTKTGKPLAKSDGNGLTFTLSAAGKAVWVLRYRIGKRRFELTLGAYPDLGLADARAMGFRRVWFGTDGPGFYERLGARRHLQRSAQFWTMVFDLAPADGSVGR